MKLIQPYLIFDGNCRDAMTFYKEALAAELDLMPWNEAPGVPPAEEGRVIHARLHKGAAILMASDNAPGMAWHQGDNFSVCLDCDSPDEQDRCFAALGAGGHITMPLGDTFWGARFGMLVDRFGINWMLSYALPQA